MVCSGAVLAPLILPYRLLVHPHFHKHNITWSFSSKLPLSTFHLNHYHLSLLCTFSFTFFVAPFTLPLSTPPLLRITLTHSVPSHRLFSTPPCPSRSLPRTRKEHQASPQTLANKHNINISVTEWRRAAFPLTCERY